MKRHQIIAEDCAAAFALTKPLWGEVAGKRIFVTGGTGFFGRWLLGLLIRASEELAFDCEVVVLTRTPEEFRVSAPHLAQHHCVQLMKGDVRTFSFPSGRFDFVAHFGSTGPRSLHDSDPLGFFDLVVEGTRRVLEFSVQAGVRRFLLASTGAVYGPSFAKVQADGSLVADLIRESRLGGPDVTSASAANAESKRVAEFLACDCARRHPALAIKIARGFTFVGPYLPGGAGFAIYDFLQDGIAGRPISVKGDGTPLRSYLYASDLAVWLWTILVRAPAGIVWNVGSDQPVSISQVAEMSAACAAAPPRVEVAGIPANGVPVSSYVPDVSKARQSLGLTVTVPLDEALQRTFRWFAC